MENRTIIAIALLLASATAHGQTSQERTITQVRMAAVGAAEIQDTYLSPEHYHGPELRYISLTQREREGRKWWREIVHQGQASILDNRSGNGGEIAAMYNFQYGWHRHLLQRPLAGGTLQVSAGGNVDVDLGFVYNTRGSNNPAQAIARLYLTPVGEAAWATGARRPVRVGYRAELPLAGLSFMPAYGQSYYEIFTEGHYDHNVAATWAGHALCLRQMLTVDLRLGRTTLRVGYLGDIRQSKANHLRQHQYTHAVAIGVVRRLGVRKLTSPTLYP